MKNKQARDYLSDLAKRTTIIPIVTNAIPIISCEPELTIPLCTIYHSMDLSPAIPLIYHSTNDNIPKPTKKTMIPKIITIVFLIVIPNLYCDVNINFLGGYQ
jgi:hypothetical protein